MSGVLIPNGGSSTSTRHDLDLKMILLCCFTLYILDEEVCVARS